MKKKRLKQKPAPWLGWVLAAAVPVLGLAIWTWSCFHRGGGWQISTRMIWVRGAVLLLSAAWVLHLAGLKGRLERLFPLAWLAASVGFWNLCIPGNVPSWGWVLMALASLGVASGIRDTRLFLALEAPLWAGMTYFMTSSLLMPLAFLFGKKRDLKGAAWLRWAALIAVLALFGAFRAWSGPGLLKNGWLATYDFPTQYRYFAFMVLALLAAVGSERSGFVRRGVVQFFLVWAGWILWSPLEGSIRPFEAAGVMFILAAGLGLETLKNELLDDSWHGRLVVASLGILLFLALFKGA